MLDEWYHRDFNFRVNEKMSDETLRFAYEFNNNMNGIGGMSFETFAKITREQELRNDEWAKNEWENNRPSSYETWKLLAKVIVTANPSHYKPTLTPNTHWKNWTESGSL